MQASISISIKLSAKMPQLYSFYCQTTKTKKILIFKIKCINVKQMTLPICLQNV